MSLTVTSLSAVGSNAVSAISDQQAQKPVPKPTQDEQIDTLASSGQSASQIATSLGLTVTEVDTTLGVTATGATATSSASALVALSGRLDVQA